MTQLALRLAYNGVIYSKKNSKRIIINRKTGKTGLISSDKALANEHDMIAQFLSQKPRYQIPSPVSVEIDIYEPNKFRRDLDNQATSILDALTRARIIEDDSIHHVTALHVRLAGIDSNLPHAIIKIKHLANDDKDK